MLIPNILPFETIDEFGYFSIVMLALGLVVSIITPWFICKMFTPWREHQNRLFYHKKSQTLELPRLDLKIPHDDILEFCVFSGNYHLKHHRFAIISELSVIFRHENQTKRASVILQGKGKAKSYAQKLAELTQVKFNMYYQIPKKQEQSKGEQN